MLLFTRQPLKFIHTPGNSDNLVPQYQLIIKRMLQLDQNEFGQFRERFLKTYSVSQPDKLLSEAMGEAELEAKILFAWQQYLADQHLAEFAEIFPVYAKMPPVMVALFDTDCTHWGAPYPMPDIVYPSDYPLVHYR